MSSKKNRRTKNRNKIEEMRFLDEGLQKIERGLERGEKFLDRGQATLARKTTNMTDLLDGLIKRGITALDFAYEKDGQPAGCLLLDHVPPVFDTGSGRFAASEVKQRNDKFRVEGSLSRGRFRLLVLQDGHTLTATLRYAEPWAEYGGKRRLTVEVHEKKKN
ncbi:hypothetical protein pqer_cds_614 [Pandoravirus quercus]|uniref:Uncharacterized protein n=2 Tax=Pandoravirus TaxID=2060084 RepID=A0A2U7U9C8_9VIRU|nr:hypothetical protein pqer_cds_614 [Pandoravirus quercus]AVK75036.1 hypothetical protein pqer_cds_614 [Pandoravirus quercus]QBZ81264.1 hypothetical protein pclt_cds_677 [Pandoravirus celtis]